MADVEFSLETISPEQCAALDLCDVYLQALADFTKVELYRVRVYDEDGFADNTNACYALYMPEERRGGVAWGSDAQWFDADSAQELVNLAL